MRNPRPEFGCPLRFNIIIFGYKYRWCTSHADFSGVCGFCSCLNRCTMCRAPPNRGLGPQGKQERCVQQPNNTMGQAEAGTSDHHMEADIGRSRLLIPLSAVPKGACKVWIPHQLPDQCRSMVHRNHDRTLSSCQSIDISTKTCNMQQVEIWCIAGAVLLQMEETPKVCNILRCIFHPRFLLQSFWDCPQSREHSVLKCTMYSPACGSAVFEHATTTP